MGIAGKSTEFARPQSDDFDTKSGRNSVENSVGGDSKSAIWPPKKSASNLDFSD